jgi:hypothetical protein
MKKINIILLAIAMVAAIVIIVSHESKAPDGNRPGGNKEGNGGNGTSSDQTLTDFPSLYIELEGEPFVDRETWLDTTVSLIGMESDELNFEDVEGSIRGRGRSSWARHKEKRSLRLRFPDSERAMSADGKPHEDWVLIGNHGDKSLMRNYTAYHLAGLLDGMSWAPYARFMHLFINNEYMGVYMLADERDKGKQRGRWKRNEDPEICEYFLEMDWRLYRHDRVEDVDYFRVNTHEVGVIGDSRHGNDEGGVRDMLYEVKYPKQKRMTPEHMAYAKSYIESVSRAIRAQDFDEIASLVDIPAMIDFMIVQDFMRNSDVGWSSVFMQIKGQGDERRLHMGPVWDFDVAAGNYDAVKNQEPYGLYIQQQHYWYRHLMATPEFREAYVKRWNDVGYDAVSKTLEHIKELATEFEESFEANFNRHDVMGEYVWPNPPHVVEIDTFMGQVDYLIDFLERRAKSINDILNEQS